MTRSSSICIGVGAFVVAMMLTIGIDTFGRNIGMSSIFLGGSTAFAQLSIELPDPSDVIENLEVETGDDDDDDDNPAADDDGDDN